MILVDIASLLGIILGLLAIVFGVISSAGLGGVYEYLDYPSVIITFGGAFYSKMIIVNIQKFI